VDELVLDIAVSCSPVDVAKQTAAIEIHLGRDRSTRHLSAVGWTPIQSTGGPYWANISTAPGGRSR